MEYSRIINRSFEIAWKYKSLWILGLFAGGSTGSFNFDLGNLDRNHTFGSNFSTGNFPSLDYLIPLLILGGIIALFFLILHLICMPGLIDGVNKIARGGTYRFSTSFARGVDFVWRYLGLLILGIFAGIAGVGFLIFLAVITYHIHVVVFILSLLVLVPVFFVGIWILQSVMSLSIRAMVVRDISIGDAIEEGYTLFRRYPMNNFVIFLIYIGLTIGLGLLAMMIWLLFAIPITLVVNLMGVELIASLVFGLLIGLPISIVVGGFLGTVFSNLYTIFYFELVEPGRATLQQPPSPQPAV